MYESIAVALNRTLTDEMRRDPSVIVLGEDVGAFGGGYQITKGLLDKFGPSRVRNTPISEIAIVGASIGAALTGLRPVAEIQFADFMFCGMDQLVNQAAKMHLMFGGQASVPMVIRAPQGATGRAAQHSQCVEAFFMHVPGIKIAMPSTPYDARGLLFSAIRDNNPVLFLEHKLLYGSTSPGGKAKSATGSLTTLTPAPEEEYAIPFGVADIKRRGTDVTVVATLHMVHLALKAAETLAGEGMSVEVIDPRTVVPLDKQAILDSVSKTGRLVVTSEDVTTCGFASEVAALAAENCLGVLKAPVERVCSLDVPIPFAPDAERNVLPSEEKLTAAIRRAVDGRSSVRMMERRS